MESDEDWEIGYRELAHAIEKVGEIYERVEAAKRRQMVELEKQRMQFAKDLEYQRMQLFMETQVHLHKIKPSKRSSDAGLLLTICCCMVLVVVVVVVFVNLFCYLVLLCYFWVGGVDPIASLP